MWTMQTLAVWLFAADSLFSLVDLWFLSVCIQYLWPISPIRPISPMQCFYGPQLPDDWRQGSGNGRPALVKYLRHRSQPDREVPAVWWPQILILFGGHLLWTDEVGCLSWKQIAMQRSLGVYVLNFVQYGACLYMSVQYHFFDTL